MVTKQVEAKQDMLGMLEDVRGRNTHYVVSYQGQPMAAVVPLRVHEEWERERRSFFDQMEETARRGQRVPVSRRPARRDHAPLGQARDRGRDLVINP